MKIMNPETHKLAVKRLDDPDDTVTFDNGKLEVVTFGSVTVKRATVEPDWKWSNDVAPLMGTDCCESHHILYIISGRLRIELDDGAEAEGGPGDVMEIPPRHDSWVVSDEPLVYVDFDAGPTSPK